MIAPHWVLSAKNFVDGVMGEKLPFILKAHDLTSFAKPALMQTVFI